MPSTQPRHLPAPLQRLRSYLTDPDAPRRLIALVGLPGSGKSTIAQRWADGVNLAHREMSVASAVAWAKAGPPAVPSPPAMVALSMDGFHLTKAKLARFADPVEAFKRRGAPWTFDAAALAKRLQALREPDTTVTWPGFEHGVGDPVADAVSVNPATRIVLVEGLYLLHDDHGWNHAHLFDETWFLDVPMKVAMARLVKRHMASNQQTLEVAQARLAGNDRLNAEIVWQSRGRAKWLVGDVD